MQIKLDLNTPWLKQSGFKISETEIELVMLIFKKTPKGLNLS